MKKVNSYVLLILFIILVICIPIACNSLVFAEEEIIQYNLTLYEENVSEPFIYSYNSSSVISLPDELSLFNRDYDYVFYEDENFSTIYEGSTITINSDTTLYFKKTIKQVKYRLYTYYEDGVKDSEYFETSLYQGHYTIPEFENHKVRKYDPTLKTIGDEIEYNTPYYEDLTLVKIPAFNVIAYNYKDEEISTTYIDWSETYVFPEKSTLSEGYKSLGWSYFNNSNKLITTPSIDIKCLEDVNIYEYVEKVFSFNITVDSSCTNYYTLSSELQNYRNTYYELIQYLLSNQVDYRAFRLVQGDYVILSQNVDNYQIDDSIEDAIDLTLYEEDIIYYIYYSLNGGSFSPNERIDYYYTYTTETFELNEPSRVGYTFLNWTKINTDEIVSTIEKGSYGDLSLVANWEANSYTIKYEIDESLGVYEDYIVKYDSYLTEINNNIPNKYGYNFLGWSYVKDNPSYIVSENNIYKYAKDVSVYPIFENKKFIITFNTGFEDLKIDSINVEYNKPIILSEPTYIGYTFKGWVYEDKVFKTDDIFLYINDITLNAVWEANKYIISLYISNLPDPQEIEVTYDSPVNLVTGYLLENTNRLIGFYLDEIKKENLIASKDGAIEKWKIAANSDIYVYSLDEELFSKNAQINISNLPEGYTILMDNKKIEEDSNIDEIGYHTILVKQNDSTIYAYDITIEADLAINSTVIYEAPITINEINATVLLDGKEIEFKNGQYRFDKSGTHTITILGADGYKQEYTYTYENKNIFYSWFFLGIGVIVMIISIVFTSLGRRHMIQNDDD